MRRPHNLTLAKVSCGLCPHDMVHHMERSWT